MARFDPFSAFRMAGCSAIVTGGARSIGSAIARGLCGAGAQVMVADIDGDKAADAAALIAAKTGGEAFGIRCDVADRESVDFCVTTSVQAFGRVSTLVNTVGWDANDAYRAPTPEKLIESCRLGAVAAMRMAVALRPHLERATNPSVTNIDLSISEQLASDIIVDAAAKAARDGLMLSLRRCLSSRVRVNAIVIGSMITPGRAAALLDRTALQAPTHPDECGGASARPEDLANACLWLASPAARGVSGLTIGVSDGAELALQTRG